MNPVPLKTWLFGPNDAVATTYLPILQDQKKCPVGGVLCMGTLTATSWYLGAPYVKATTQMCCNKYGRPDGIPGIMPFVGATGISDWYDPARWKAVVEFAEKTVVDGRFAIDFEAYWSVGTRYPGAADVLAIVKATEVLIDYVKANGVKLHALPGIHYAVTLGWALACPGQIVVLDEACYGYSLIEKRDAATWKVDLLARKAATEKMGLEWWPGFYWPGASDSEIAAIGGNQWFFVRPDDRNSVLGA